MQLTILVVRSTLSHLEAALRDVFLGYLLGAAVLVLNLVNPHLYVVLEQAIALPVLPEDLRDIDVAFLGLPWLLIFVLLIALVPNRSTL